MNTMLPLITFKGYQPQFATDLDGEDHSVDLDETTQDLETFREEVMEEIQCKGRGRPRPLQSAEAHIQTPFGDELPVGVDAAPSGDTRELANPILNTGLTQISRLSEADGYLRPDNADTYAGPLPSFHLSYILETSTPRARTSTYPTISTPSDVGTPRLPAPVKLEAHVPPRTQRSRTLETPEHIPSPIDSPSTTAPRPSLQYSEGQAKRDDPATPVPIGKSALADLRSKKDHQGVMKHFDSLAKVLVKGGRAVISNQPASKPATVAFLSGLGGKVFDGLRLCLTTEVNQASKLKQRAEIITSLGGQAVLWPDTAITHVIYDQGKSASLLAQKLGLQTLSELPEGTICVKWDWVVQCKMVGKILGCAPWLSFPKTSFSRAVSANAIRPTTRIFDITDQLRGQSVAIARKREPTASGSDTEESLRKRARLTHSRSTTYFPPVPEQSTVQAGSSRVKALAGTDVTVATEHELPTGPGWKKAKDGEMDALDAMIEGIKGGSLSDPDISDDGEHIDKIQNDFTSPEIRSGIRPYPYKSSRKSDGRGYIGPNEWLAKKFEELHDLYQGQVGKNSFAIRGYQRAAGIMRRIDYPITTGAQARAIPGIGLSLADRIDEFLTGAQGRAYYEDTEQARCVSLFKDIYGVGRQHANDLYRAGARTISDLRSGAYALTSGQKIGLELFDDLKSRIPREECREIFQIIHDEGKAIDQNLWIEIMGSYRRGQENSGDVDILITREGGEDGRRGVLGDLVDRLRNKGLITHDLGTPSDWTASEAKWMGVGRLSSTHNHRRIDILCIPYEQWGAALIYFTGNEVFNRSMRLYARKMGFSLNQRGLYKGVIRGRDGLKQTEGELVASRTEQDIFDALGLRWRHPHHRRP